MDTERQVGNNDLRYDDEPAGGFYHVVLRDADDGYRIVVNEDDLIPLRDRLNETIARSHGPPENMATFWDLQAEWSRATFGPDTKRGPEGPTKHLLKEVQEVLDCLSEKDFTNARKELVDCQFLVFDAARRCGMSFLELVALCFEKLEINKKRKWGTASMTEAVEHVREAQ